jgi:prepilin-type processing-associated H-X9-DG protein
MSPWLRKSLGLWFAGIALAIGTGLGSQRVWLSAANAQTADGVQLTPEQVSEQLSDYIWQKCNETGPGLAVTGSPEPPFQLISSADMALFEKSGVTSLLNEMAKFWYEPQYKTRRAEGGTEERVTVEVNATVQWKVRPVICVKDGNSWKVDLVATYVKWADIPESQKRDKIESITGVFLPGPMSEADNSKLCRTRLKQIGIALKQYTQDYDERFPLAVNWQDAIIPYIGHNSAVFQCPSISPPAQGGYALNNKTSGKDETRFEDSYRTVLAYESTHFKRNAHGAGEVLDWRHTEKGIPGGNFLFVDGHVNWELKKYPPSFLLQPLPHHKGDSYLPWRE